MYIVLYIASVLTVVYSVLMFVYRYGWQKRPLLVTNRKYFSPSTKISVIIPARNEEENIGACIESLLKEDYPSELLEVIVVDDHSTDNTAEIVKSYADSGVRYIDLAEAANTDKGEFIAYKKLALNTGIELSTGELIITTDADCVSDGFRLHEIVSFYEDEYPVMIVAPVRFTSDGSFLQMFQSLDFMSMQGVTVASLQLNLGNMCNGANLAFQRAAFDNVGGYSGIDHIATGDDYLLMVKLNKEYPGCLSYLKSEEAIVDTPPQTTWTSFFQQRIRWASKSGKYKDHKLTAILLVVYLYNVSLFALGLVSIFDFQLFIWLIILLVFKSMSEQIYMLPVARFYGKVKELSHFPLLQPVHVLYIVLAGLLGIFGKYEWKGRTVR